MNGASSYTAAPEASTSQQPAKLAADNNLNGFNSPPAGAPHAAAVAPIDEADDLEQTGTHVDLADVQHAFSLRNHLVANFFRFSPCHPGR